MRIAFISSFTIREHNLEELRMCINSFKKYNNIKVDWYITTDLPDLAHYFFRDFKSDTINLIYQSSKQYNEPKILNYILNHTKYIIENHRKEIQYLKDFIKLEQCKQFWDKQLALL